MKMTVFWDVAPSNFVKTNRGALYLHDDEGSKHLKNVRQFPQDYTAQLLRRP
jgi:hypothetical protein